jgi:ABC-type uncharacterized transport system permease subunit
MAAAKSQNSRLLFYLSRLPMFNGITIAVFATCYMVAFCLEIASLGRRPAWFPMPLIIAAICGLVVHGLYLVRSAIGSNSLPISTADWLLWTAWLLAIVYLTALFYLPRSPTGLVLLPIVLGLILSSHWANTEPLTSDRSFYVLGMLHGLLLLAGTVAVCIGFLAGLMYLVQSYALKHSRSAANRLRLPSLEWLERVNGRTLGISAVLIALGFASGVVMTLAKHRGEAKYALWADPVVLSLAAMLAWLVAAEIFRLVYPAARRGRKVAYLTLASFIFLVIVLASFTLLDNVHSPNHASRANNHTAASLPRSPFHTPRSPV